MADVDAQIADLKSKIAAAQIRRVRAQVAAEAASAALDEAKEALESEFGVSTPVHAREALTVLEARLGELMTRAKEMLDETP